MPGENGRNQLAAQLIEEFERLPVFRPVGRVTVWTPDRNRFVCPRRNVNAHMSACASVGVPMRDQYRRCGRQTEVAVSGHHVIGDARVNLGMTAARVGEGALIGASDPLKDVQKTNANAHKRCNQLLRGQQITQRRYEKRQMLNSKK
ncbi:hypothetical protein AHF37_05200 [Paragonimus kellicotti]|nr:hypothetical protein AHF37_05200 [Paragonimus kellicotti]